jgi:transposase
MLTKYEPLHVFPVPSTMTANMREALYPSGAKDDPRDADLLLDLLLQHRDKLRRLSPDTEVTRRVQNLVEERRNLVDEKTAQVNRLSNHLKIYFPQVLDWFEHLDTELVCALLERWPTLEELEKVRQRSCGRSSASTTVEIKNSSSAAISRFARRFPPFGIEL